jgi:hypothetical protein
MPEKRKCGECKANKEHAKSAKRKCRRSVVRDQEPSEDSPGAESKDTLQDMDMLLSESLLKNKLRNPQTVRDIVGLGKTMSQSHCLFLIRIEFHLPKGFFPFSFRAKRTCVFLMPL